MTLPYTREKSFQITWDPRISPSHKQLCFGRAEAPADALQHPEPENSSDKAKQQLVGTRTKCTPGLCLLVIRIGIERLVSDLVALYPLQEIIHHVLPVSLRVVGAGNFHLLINRQCRFVRVKQTQQGTKATLNNVILPL